jgi:zinc transport system ATP-binding protein
VDRASQGVLAGVLQRLGERGTTMLVVTHELTALRGVVDRIVEVDAGHLTFDGTPEGYAEHHLELARAARRVAS